jgi:hypothetical protein
MESKWKQSFDVSEILPADSTFCLTPEAIRPVRSTREYCELLLSATICCVAALPWQLRRAVRNFRNLIRSK